MSLTLVSERQEFFKTFMKMRREAQGFGAWPAFAAAHEGVAIATINRLLADDPDDTGVHLANRNAIAVALGAQSWAGLMVDFDDWMRGRNDPVTIGKALSEMSNEELRLAIETAIADMPIIAKRIKAVVSAEADAPPVAGKIIPDEKPKRIRPAQHVSRDRQAASHRDKPKPEDKK